MLKKQGATNYDRLEQRSIAKNAWLFYCIHYKCDNDYFSALYETHMKKLQKQEMSMSIHLKNLLTLYYGNSYKSYMINNRLTNYSDSIKKLSIAIENHKKMCML